MIKNQQGATVYFFGIPQITISNKVVGYGAYHVNKTESGFQITINMPDNINSTNAQLNFELNAGYEPGELITNGVQKYYENDILVGSASYSGPNIGRLIIIDSTNTYYAYRAYQYFDISALSSTAEIDSAHYKFTFITSYQNFNVNLQQMSKHYQSTPGLLWDDCSDGNSYGSFSSNVNGVYSEKYESWDSFCGDIKDNIGTGWFGIGFYTSDSPDENIKISSGIDTSLIIYYHDPQEYFDFNVNYDFGTGYVTINDLYNQRDENIPYNNLYQYGNTVEVTAHNQQGGDYFRVFEKWDQTIGDDDPKAISDSVSSCEVTDSINYEGRFNRRFNFTAQNNFLDGGSGGKLKVDGNPPVNAPYFRYFIEHIDQPFTIEAYDQTLNVNGRNVDCFLSQWEDGVETNPRQFTPIDNEEHTATYKGHLASNVAQATGYNNGRRAAKTYNGTYHMVYADNGTVYITSSSNGTTWGDEKRISSSNETCYNPSIATSNNMVFVTWYNSTEQEVKFRSYNSATGSWGSAYDVGAMLLGGPIAPSPAIAVSEVVGTQYNIYIIFHREQMGQDFQGNGIHEIVCYKNSNNTGSVWSQIFGPVNGKNPAISHSAAGGNGDIGMVWGNNHNIYFKKTNYGGQWSSTVQINPNVSYIWDETKPSISFSYGVAHIVWEGMEDFQEAEFEALNGFHRTYNSYTNSFGPLDEMPTHGGEDLRDLSVSTVTGNGSNYTIFYSNEGTMTKLAKTGSSMSETTYGDGLYANIIDKGRDLTVWTKYASAPYFLHPAYSQGGFSKLAEATASSHNVSLHKRFSFNFHPGQLAIELTHTGINGGQSSFLYDKNNSSVLQFTGNDALRLDWKVSYMDSTENMDPDQKLLSIYMLKDGGRSLLKTYQIGDFTRAGSRSFRDDISFYMLSPKNAKIEIVFDGIKPLVTNVLSTSNEDMSLNKAIQTSSNDVIVPQKYFLNANYPNPFNPITMLEFGVPQDGFVRLDIYNATGKHIAVLMKKHVQAGSYDVAFDASGLASGIYIYRLQAGNFSQTRRMLLIK